VAESDLNDADRDRLAGAPDLTPSADAFDYTRPDLPLHDLILVARQRVRDAVKDDPWAVYPWNYQGDERLSVAQREALAEWPPFEVDLDQLDAQGWPPLAIAVWCFPYLFDLHEKAGTSVEEAATVCLKRLEREGLVPASWPADQHVKGTHGEAEDRIGPDPSQIVPARLPTAEENAEERRHRRRPPGPVLTRDELLDRLADGLKRTTAGARQDAKVRGVTGLAGLTLSTVYSYFSNPSFGWPEVPMPWGRVRRLLLEHLRSGRSWDDLLAGTR
jgi:hypothetical protein